MNNNSLLTTPLSHDANVIITAINQRTSEIQQMLKNISIPQKISLTVAKILVVTAGLVALATVPTALLQMSLKPLAYGSVSLAICIASGALVILMDNRSATEAIIKDEWHALFTALKNNNVAAIFAKSKSLIKKKKQNNQAFNNALRLLPSSLVDTFLQKSLFTAHILTALHALDDGQTEEAKSHAHLALACFVLSGLPTEAADCANSIVNKPGRVINRLNQSGCPKSINDLDTFLSMMSGLLDDEHLHDFVRL